MMIRMFLWLQVLVISILLKEFELKSSNETRINKRQPSYMNDLIAVDGKWSVWSPWSYCSKTCGPDSGSRIRVRECDSPSPQHGGKDCPGTNIKESEECNKSECPIHGGWSQWSAMSSCFQTCGKRERECDNPSPKFGGRDCEGPKMDEKICSADCPVDGMWTQWSGWTQCKKSCGEEFQNRYRSCTVRSPQKGGSTNPSTRNKITNCEGDAKESKFCNNKQCQRDLKKMSNQNKIVFPIIGSIGAVLGIAVVIGAVMYRRKNRRNSASVSSTEQSVLYQESERE